MLGLDARSSLALARNRPDEALLDAQRAVRVARRLGEVFFEATCIAAYGNALTQAGRLDEALVSFKETLQLARPRGYHAAIADALRGIARLLSMAGNPQAASRAAAAATTLQRAAGIPLSGINAVAFEQLLTTLRAALPEAVFEAEWAATTAMPIEDAIDHALASS